MKRVLCICGLFLLLSGCMPSKQPNDLAYVISMSVDRLDNGEIEIAVQMPAIASGTGDGSGSSDYAIMSASGATFSQALDVMESTSQRALNLTHMKTLICSADLASEEDFSQLLTEIMLTYRLYGEASLVISMNPARELLTAQRAVIGERLAQSVAASLDHFTEHGYTPRVTLSDVFFRMHSVYSDPVGILAATADGAHFRAIPPDRMGDAYPGALPRTGANQNEYYGAALFSRGRMVGTLTGLEENLRGALTGDIRQMPRSYEGKAIRLSVIWPGRYEVDLSGERPRIHVSLHLRMISLNTPPDPEKVAAYVEQDLMALFQKCQSLRCEPFGIAETAAAQFAALEDWRACDWREMFARAEISVEVGISL